METTKNLTLSQAISEFISRDNVTREDLKQFRKELSEEIKRRKYANLSEAERAALAEFEKFNDQRKQFYTKVDKKYFTANRARTVVLPELRSVVGYNKRKGSVSMPEKAKTFATAKQLENWDRFSPKQFAILCKSHNSTLKMLLQADKLPAKITPRAYIAGIMRGALLSESAFSKRMALKLPK